MAYNSPSPRPDGRGDVTLDLSGGIGAFSPIGVFSPPPNGAHHQQQPHQQQQQLPFASPLLTGGGGGVTYQHDASTVNAAALLNFNTSAVGAGAGGAASPNSGGMLPAMLTHTNTYTQAHAQGTGDDTASHTNTYASAGPSLASHQHHRFRGAYARAEQQQQQQSAAAAAQQQPSAFGGGIGGADNNNTINTYGGNNNKNTSYSHQQQQQQYGGGQHDPSAFEGADQFIGVGEAAAGGGPFGGGGRSPRQQQGNNTSPQLGHAGNGGGSIGLPIPLQTKPSSHRLVATAAAEMAAATEGAAATPSRQVFARGGGGAQETSYEQQQRLLASSSNQHQHQQQHFSQQQQQHQSAHIFTPPTDAARARGPHYDANGGYPPRGDVSPRSDVPHAPTAAPSAAATPQRPGGVGVGAGGYLLLPLAPPPSKPHQASRHGGGGGGMGDDGGVVVPPMAPQETASPSPPHHQQQQQNRRQTVMGAASPPDGGGVAHIYSPRDNNAAVGGGGALPPYGEEEEYPYTFDEEAEAAAIEGRGDWYGGRKFGAESDVNSSQFSVAPFAAPTSGRLVRRHQDRAARVARCLYFVALATLILGAFGVVLVVRDHSFGPLLRSKRKLLTYRLHTVAQRALEAVFEALPADGKWVPPTNSTSNLTLDSGTTAYTDLFTHGSYIFHAAGDAFIDLAARPNQTLYAIDDSDFRNRHSGPAVERIRFNSLMRSYATKSQQLRRDRIDRVATRLVNELSVCSRSARRVGSFVPFSCTDGAKVDTSATAMRALLPNDATHEELMRAAGVASPPTRAEAAARLSAQYSRGSFSIATNSHRVPVSCLVDPDDPLIEYFSVTRTRPQYRGPSVPLSSSASAASDPTNRLQSVSFVPSKGTRLISDGAVSVLSMQQFRGLCMQERVYRVESGGGAGDNSGYGDGDAASVGSTDGAELHEGRGHRAANRPADLGRSYAVRRIFSPGSCGEMPSFGGGNSLWGGAREGATLDIRVDGSDGDFVGYRGVPVRGVSSINSNASIGLATLVDSESLSHIVSPLTGSYFSGILNQLYLLAPTVLRSSTQQSPPLWLAGNVDIDPSGGLAGGGGGATSSYGLSRSDSDDGSNEGSDADHLAAWQARVGMPDSHASQPETSFSSGAVPMTFHDARRNWQFDVALWVAATVAIAWLLFVLLWEGYFAMMAALLRRDVGADVLAGRWARAAQLERVLAREEREERSFWDYFSTDGSGGYYSLEGVGVGGGLAAASVPAAGGVGRSDYSIRQYGGAGVLKVGVNGLGDRVTGFDDAVHRSNLRAQAARRERRSRQRWYRIALKQRALEAKERQAAEAAAAAAAAGIDPHTHQQRKRSAAAGVGPSLNTNTNNNNNNASSRRLLGASSGSRPEGATLADDDDDDAATYASSVMDAMSQRSSEAGAAPSVGSSASANSAADLAYLYNTNVKQSNKRQQRLLLGGGLLDSMSGGGGGGGGDVSSSASIPPLAALLGDVDLDDEGDIGDDGGGSFVDPFAAARVRQGRRRRRIAVTIAFSVVAALLVGLGVGISALAAVRLQQRAMGHITEGHVRMEARAIATVLSSSMSLYRNESTARRGRPPTAFPPPYFSGSGDGNATDGFNSNSTSNSNNTIGSSGGFSSAAPAPQLITPDRDFQYFYGSAMDQTLTSVMTATFVRHLAGLNVVRVSTTTSTTTTMPSSAASSSSFPSVLSVGEGTTIAGHTVSIVRPPTAAFLAQERTAEGRTIWEGFLASLNKPQSFADQQSSALDGATTTAQPTTTAAGQPNSSNPNPSSDGGAYPFVVTPFIALPPQSARYGDFQRHAALRFSPLEREAFHTHSLNVQSVNAFGSSSSAFVSDYSDGDWGPDSASPPWRPSAGLGYASTNGGDEEAAKVEYNSQAAVPSYAIDYLFSDLNSHREISGVSQLDAFPQNSPKLTVFDSHESHTHFRSAGSTAYAAVYLPSHHVAVFVVARTEMILDGPALAGVIVGVIVFTALALLAALWWLKLAKYAPFAEGSVLLRRYGPKTHHVRNSLYATIFCILLVAVLLACYHADMLRSRAVVAAQERLTAVYAQTVAAVGALRNVDVDVIISKMRTPSSTEAIQFAMPGDGIIADNSGQAQISAAAVATDASTSSLLSSSTDSSRVFTSISTVFSVISQPPENIQQVSIPTLAAIAELFNATSALALSANFFAPSVFMDTPVKVSNILAMGPSALTAAATLASYKNYGGSAGANTIFGRPTPSYTPSSAFSLSSSVASRGSSTYSSSPAAAQRGGGLGSVRSDSDADSPFVENPTIAISANSASPTQYDNPIHIRVLGKRALRYPVPHSNIRADPLFNISRLNAIQTRWSIASAPVASVAVAQSRATAAAGGSSSSTSASSSSTAGGVTSSNLGDAASSSSGSTTTSTDDSSAATSFSDAMRTPYRTYGKASASYSSHSALGGPAPANWENYFSGAALAISRVAAVLPAAPAYFSPIVNLVKNTTNDAELVTALVATAIPNALSGHRGVVVQRLTSESDSSSGSRGSSLSPLNSGSTSSTLATWVPSTMRSLVDNLPFTVSLFAMLAILVGVTSIVVLGMEVLFGIAHRMRVAPFGTLARDVVSAVGIPSSSSSSSDDDDEDEDEEEAAERARERRAEARADRRLSRQRAQWLFARYFDKSRDYPWFIYAGLIASVALLCAAAVPLGGLVLQSEMDEAVARATAAEVKWVLEAGRDALEEVANSAALVASRRMFVEAGFDHIAGRVMHGQREAALRQWAEGGNVSFLSPDAPPTEAVSALFNGSFPLDSFSFERINASFSQRTWVLDSSCAASRSPSRITNAALYRSLLQAVAQMQEHVGAAIPFAVTWRLLIQNRSAAAERGFGQDTWLSLNPERSIAANVPNFTAGIRLGQLQRRFEEVYRTALAEHTAELKAQFLNNSNNNANSTSTAGGGGAPIGIGDYSNASSGGESFVPTITAASAQRLRDILLEYRDVASEQLIRTVTPTEFPLSVADLFRLTSGSVPSRSSTASSSLSSFRRLSANFSAVEKGLVDVVTVPGLTTASVAAAHATMVHEENTLTMARGRTHLNNDNLNAEFSTVFSAPVSHLTALTHGVDTSDGDAMTSGKKRVADGVVPNCPRCAYAAIRLRVGLRRSMCGGTLTTTTFTTNFPPKDSLSSGDGSSINGSASSSAVPTETSETTVEDLNSEEELSFALLLAVDTHAPSAGASPHSAEHLAAESTSAFLPVGVRRRIGEVNGTLFVLTLLLSCLLLWYVLESGRHHEEDVALGLLADTVATRQQQRAIVARRRAERAKEAADEANGNDTNNNDQNGGPLKKTKSAASLFGKRFGSRPNLRAWSDAGSSATGGSNDKKVNGKNKNGRGRRAFDSDDDSRSSGDEDDEHGSDMHSDDDDASDMGRSKEVGGHTAILQPEWKDDGAAALLFPRGEPFATVDRTDVVPAACRSDIPTDMIHQQGAATMPSILPRASRITRLLCVIFVPLGIAAAVGVVHLWVLAGLVSQREHEMARQHKLAEVSFFTSPHSARVLASPETLFTSDANAALQAASEAVFLGSTGPIGRTHGGIEVNSRSQSVVGRTGMPMSHGVAASRYVFRNADLKSTFEDSMGTLTSFTALAANGNANRSRSRKVPVDLDTFMLSTAVTTAPYLRAMAEPTWSPHLQPTSRYAPNLAAAQAAVANTVSTTTFASPLRHATLAESQCANFNDCFFSVLRRHFLTEQVQEQGSAFVALRSIQSRYFSFLNAMPSIVTDVTETTVGRVRAALRAEREGRIVNPTEPIPKTTTTRAPTASSIDDSIDGTNSNNHTNSSTSNGNTGGNKNINSDGPSAEEIFGNMTTEPLDVAAHAQFVIALSAIEDHIRRLQLLDYLYLEAGLFPAASVSNESSTSSDVAGVDSDSEGTANGEGPRHSFGNWSVTYTEPETPAERDSVTFGSGVGGGGNLTYSGGGTTYGNGVTNGGPTPAHAHSYADIEVDGSDLASSLPYSSALGGLGASSSSGVNPTLAQYGTLFGRSLVHRRLFGTNVLLSAIAPFFPLCCAAANVTRISDEEFADLARNPTRPPPPTSASARHGKKRKNNGDNNSTGDDGTNETDAGLSPAAAFEAFDAASYNLQHRRERVDAMCNCTHQVLTELAGPMAFAAAERTVEKIEAIIDGLMDPTLLLTVFNNGTAFAKGDEVLRVFEAEGDAFVFNDTEIGADGNVSYVLRTLGDAVAAAIGGGGIASDGGSSSTSSSSATISGATIDPTSIAISVRSSLRSLKATLIRRASIIASFNPETHTAWQKQVNDRSIFEGTLNGEFFGSTTAAAAAAAASSGGVGRSTSNGNFDVLTEALSNSAGSSGTSGQGSVLSAVTPAAAATAAMNTAVAAATNAAAIATATTASSRALYYAQLWELQRLRLVENEGISAGYSDRLSQWNPTVKQIRDLTIALAGQSDFSSFVASASPSTSSSSSSSASANFAASGGGSYDTASASAAVAYTLLGDGQFLTDGETPTALVRNFLVVDTQLRALLASIGLIEASPPSSAFLDSHGNSRRTVVNGGGGSGGGGSGGGSVASAAGSMHTQRLRRFPDGFRATAALAPASFQVFPAANWRYNSILTSERKALFGALETITVVVAAACCALAAVGVIVGILNSIHGAAFVLTISRQKASALPPAAIRRRSERMLRKQLLAAQNPSYADGMGMGIGMGGGLVDFGMGFGSGGGGSSPRHSGTAASPHGSDEPYFHPSMLPNPLLRGDIPFHELTPSLLHRDADMRLAQQEREMLTGGGTLGGGGGGWFGGGLRSGGGGSRRHKRRGDDASDAESSSGAEDGEYSTSGGSGGSSDSDSDDGASTNSDGDDDVESRLEGGTLLSGGSGARSGNNKRKSGKHQQKKKKNKKKRRKALKVVPKSSIRQLIGGGLLWLSRRAIGTFTANGDAVELLKINSNSNGATAGQGGRAAASSSANEGEGGGEAAPDRGAVIARHLRRYERRETVRFEEQFIDRVNWRHFRRAVATSTIGGLLTLAALLGFTVLIHAVTYDSIHYEAHFVEVDDVIDKMLGEIADIRFKLLLSRSAHARDLAAIGLQLTTITADLSASDAVDLAQYEVVVDSTLKAMYGPQCGRGSPQYCDSFAKSPATAGRGGFFGTADFSSTASEIDMTTGGSGALQGPVPLPNVCQLVRVPLTKIVISGVGSNSSNGNATLAANATATNPYSSSGNQILSPLYSYRLQCPRVIIPPSNAYSAYPNMETFIARTPSNAPRVAYNVTATNGHSAVVASHTTIASVGEDYASLTNQVTAMNLQFPSQQLLRAARASAVAALNTILVALEGSDGVGAGAGGEEAAPPPLPMTIGRKMRRRQRVVLSMIASKLRRILIAVDTLRIALEEETRAAQQSVVFAAQQAEVLFNSFSRGTGVRMLLTNEARVRLAAIAGGAVGNTTSGAADAPMDSSAAAILHDMFKGGSSGGGSNTDAAFSSIQDVVDPSLLVSGTEYALLLAQQVRVQNYALNALTSMVLDALASSAANETEALSSVSSSVSSSAPLVYITDVSDGGHNSNHNHTADHYAHAATSSPMFALTPAGYDYLHTRTASATASSSSSTSSAVDTTTRPALLSGLFGSLLRPKINETAISATAMSLSEALREDSSAFAAIDAFVDSLLPLSAFAVGRTDADAASDETLHGNVTTTVANNNSTNSSSPLDGNDLLLTYALPRAAAHNSLGRYLTASSRLLTATTNSLVRGTASAFVDSFGTLHKPLGKMNFTECARQYIPLYFFNNYTATAAANSPSNNGSGSTAPPTTVDWIDSQFELSGGGGIIAGDGSGLSNNNMASTVIIPDPCDSAYDALHAGLVDAVSRLTQFGRMTQTLGGPAAAEVGFWAALGAHQSGSLSPAAHADYKEVLVRSLFMAGPQRIEMATRVADGVIGRKGNSSSDSTTNSSSSASSFVHGDETIPVMVLEENISRIEEGSDAFSALLEPFYGACDSQSAPLQRLGLAVRAAVAKHYYSDAAEAETEGYLMKHLEGTAGGDDGNAADGNDDSYCYFYDTKDPFNGGDGNSSNSSSPYPLRLVSSAMDGVFRNSPSYASYLTGAHFGMRSDVVRVAPASNDSSNGTATDSNSTAAELTSTEATLMSLEQLRLQALLPLTSSQARLSLPIASAAEGAGAALFARSISRRGGTASLPMWAAVYGRGGGDENPNAPLIDLLPIPPSPASDPAFGDGNIDDRLYSHRRLRGGQHGRRRRWFWTPTTLLNLTVEMGQLVMRMPKYEVSATVSAYTQLLPADGGGAAGGGAGASSSSSSSVSASDRASLFPTVSARRTAASTSLTPLTRFVYFQPQRTIHQARELYVRNRNHRSFAPQAALMTTFENSEKSMAWVRLGAGGSGDASTAAATSTATTAASSTTRAPTTTAAAGPQTTSTSVATTAPTTAAAPPTMLAPPKKLLQPMNDFSTETALRHNPSLSFYSRQFGSVARLYQNTHTELSRVKAVALVGLSRPVGHSAADEADENVKEGLATLHQVAPRSGIGNEAGSSEAAAFTDRQSLLRQWFNRQIASLAVGGGSGASSAGLTSPSTNAFSTVTGTTYAPTGSAIAATAVGVLSTAAMSAGGTVAAVGPATGISDIVFSPSQIATAQLLWSQHVGASGAVAAVPPTVAEVLRAVGTDPFSPDQTYLSIAAQRALSRLVGTAADPSAVGSVAGRVGSTDSDVLDSQLLTGRGGDAFRVRSQADLLRETIRWMVVAVPSAYDEPHARTDYTNCAPFYKSGSGAAASASASSLTSLSQQFGSVFADADAAASSVDDSQSSGAESSYSSSSSSSSAYSSSSSMCAATNTASLPLKDEQRLLQLIGGYAAGVLMLDDVDSGGAPALPQPRPSVEGEKGGQQFSSVSSTSPSFHDDGDDGAPIDGSEWYDSLLSSQAANGGGTTPSALLARASGRIAVWAGGLQGTFRLVQWLVILMLWVIGATAAWVYYRLGLHRD